MKDSDKQCLGGTNFNLIAFIRSSVWKRFARFYVSNVGSLFARWCQRVRQYMALFFCPPFIKACPLFVLIFQFQV
jgi:hypothetical protein